MKIKYWKNYFDVVILPPKDIFNYSIHLSKKLKKHKSHLLLGRKNFLPHISLYHISVKQKDFNKFISDIEQAVKNFKSGYLRINDLKSVIFGVPNSIFPDQNP